MDFDRSILFYDGVCHLCHGLVQFVLKYEQNHDLMFSSLQSSFAKSFLPADLSMTLKTVVVYDSKNNQILTKSDAVIFILNQMGGIWRFNAYLLRLFQ
ncbi:MAG: DCC1-like thiol-disulfide oxidoreductase family protein [Candidatus Margulisiibacteriota bacterium]